MLAIKPLFVMKGLMKFQKLLLKFQEFLLYEMPNDLTLYVLGALGGLHSPPSLLVFLL